MPTAEAVVQTPDPSRYLARLRNHTGKMRAHPGHRQRRHDGGGTPPEIQHAEWSATTGTVTTNWGRWTVQATAGTLRLCAEADDEQNLRRIQDMLARRLESFGRREQLTLTWQPPETPAY